jgi:hypothetical protein
MSSSNIIFSLIALKNVITASKLFIAKIFSIISEELQSIERISFFSL